MKNIMPDIFKLYDTIEQNMNNYYRAKNPGGRYGATKGVVVPKQGVELKSKFMCESMDVQSPNGFIYPILGAFRALVTEKDGLYAWKKNPFAILEKYIQNGNRRLLTDEAIWDWYDRMKCPAVANK